MGDTVQLPLNGGGGAARGPKSGSGKPRGGRGGRPSDKDEAAIKIQKVFRGYKVRKDLENENVAATKIQANYRGFQERKKLGKGGSAPQRPPATEEEEEAAQIVQANFRGFRARRQLSTQDNKVGEFMRKRTSGKGGSTKQKQTSEFTENPEFKKYLKKGPKTAAVTVQQTPARIAWLRLSEKVRGAVQLDLKERRKSIFKSVQAEVHAKNSAGVGNSARRREGKQYLNRGFVFFMPTVAGTGVIEAFRSICSKYDVSVIQQGRVDPKVLERQQILDYQYYKVAAAATLVKPEHAGLNTVVFQKMIGHGLRALLDKRLLYNCTDCMKTFSLTEEDLLDFWDEAVSDGHVYQVAPFVKCAKIQIMIKNGNVKRTVYVLNAFYLRFRQSFVNAGIAIQYFIIKWSDGAISWGEMLKKVIGSPLPEEPEASSFRGMLRRRWKSLGLRESPPYLNVGVHAAKSPFEALTERMNWCSVNCEKDHYGKVLISHGITVQTIKRWATNPLVYSDRMRQTRAHVFDLCENLSSNRCTIRLISLNIIDGIARSNAVHVIEANWKKMKVKKTRRELEAERKSSAFGSSTVEKRAQGGNRRRASIHEEDMTFPMLKEALQMAGRHALKNAKKETKKLSIADEDRPKSGASVDSAAKVAAKSVAPEPKTKTKRDKTKWNQALVLLEYYAVSDRAIKMVTEAFSAFKVVCRSKGPVTSEEIAKRRIVDQHFYREARIATSVDCRTINVPRLKFEALFKESWNQVIKEGRAYNALDAINELVLDADMLADLWKKAVDDGNYVISGRGQGHGTMVGRIAYDDPTEGTRRDVFICGGQYLEQRRNYTKSGTVTYYFSVEWDPEVLLWSDFNERLIGSRDGKPADGSLRSFILKHWELLEIRKQPTDRQVCITGSRSALSGMTERINWLDFKVETDYFAIALKNAGMPAACIDILRFDPVVRAPGRSEFGTSGKQCASQYVDGLDVKRCIQAMMAVKDQLEDFAKQAAGETKREKAQRSTNWGVNQRRKNPAKPISVKRRWTAQESDVPVESKSKPAPRAEFG